MNEESLFHLLLQQPDAAARAAVLDQTCANQPELRARIEKLLQAHDAPVSLFDKPAVEAATSDEVSPGHGTDPADMPSNEGPGSRIGPYKLLQQIGEGGMGVVYMAEQQEPVRRKVALKIIKPGMDSSQVIARFDAERQALALMDHQNIARVLDAGTTASGRPYFVMELVKGVPITKFCDDNHLTPRERLELFVPVCQAIQHAHQKGIIHRDIKPSNVLVTLYDGKPVPKVIDFGVAKAIEQRLTERTLFTQIGQVVGTLEYMSPEQAEINALDIDTRSDIYSLGVLLYELLTGSTPLEKQKLRSAAFTEMLRMIREEEPPKPSTRLSESREQLASISAQRKTEPAKLTKLVRGELDWIVMKALEKDRHRRYETANGFARDVQRYLADEPVEACPPSAVYKLRKFARKNRKALATVGAFALLLLALLVLGLGNAWWWMQKQTAAETEARAAFDEAVRWQQQERWSEAISAVRRAQGVLHGFGTDANLRKQVDELSKDLEMAQRLEDARLHTAVKDDHFDIEVAITAYTDAFAWFGLDMEHGNPSPSAEYIRSRSITKQLVAALEYWAGLERLMKRQEWKHLLAVAKASDPHEWRNRLRDAWERGDGKAMNDLLASAEMESFWRTTVHMLCLPSSERMGVSAERMETFLRQMQEQHPDDFWINDDLGRMLATRQPPKLEEAIGYYRAAVALRPRSPGAHNNLGYYLQKIGQLDEAIVQLREAIRLKKDYCAAHDQLGSALQEKGQLGEGIAECREAIRLNKDSSWAHNNLGVALHRNGQKEEAMTEYREAIRIKRDDAAAHNNLGTSLFEKGQSDEAIAEYRQAIRHKKDFAMAHSNLGAALLSKGQLDQAIDELRQAIRLEEDQLAHRYPGAALLSHSNLGAALTRKGQLDEAMTELREAIRIKKDYPEAHLNLGSALAKKGQLDEAIAEYRQAIRFKDDFAEAHCNLGHALRDQGRLANALAEFKRGHALGSRNPSWPHPSALWVRNCERLVELDGKLLAILNGRKQPADSAERLALAQLCQLPCKKLHVAALRFYLEAFADDPKLADNLNAQHRYNAACAAALAGCGQGSDVDKLDTKQRAHLRQQALDWLRADLKVYLQMMEKAAGKAGPEITQRMQHWLKDKDFASVRGNKALAKLPEAERKDWHKLWEEVETLRQRATQQSKTPSSARP